MPFLPKPSLTAASIRAPLAAAILALFAVIAGVPAHAQHYHEPHYHEQHRHEQPYNRWEFYGGYSFERTNIFPGDEIDTQPFITTVTPGPVAGGSKTITETPGTKFGTGSGVFHNLHGFNLSTAYNVTRFWSAKVDFTANYGQTVNNTVPGGNFLESDNLTQITIAPATGIQASQRNYNVMGGVQYQDNATHRALRPFAHALFGIAPQRLRYANLDLLHQAIIGGYLKPNNNVATNGSIIGIGSSPNFVSSGSNVIATNSFAMSFGIGADYHYSRQFDIRLFQFDYTPVFAATQTLLYQNELIDSTITNFPNGNRYLTSLQSITVPGHRQDNYRLSIGIVIHK